MGQRLARSRLVCLTLFVLALFSGGCGKKGPQPYPVKGTLRVNGEPAVGALIAFHATPPFAKTLVPTGVVDAEGNFHLTSFAAKDGAPVGEYKVSIMWPVRRRGIRPEGDRLNGAYVNPDNTGLTAHVEAKDNVLPPFELKTPPPPDPAPDGEKPPKPKDDH
jgi:hypothetical protein